MIAVATKQPDFEVVGGVLYARTIKLLSQAVGMQDRSLYQDWRGKGCPGKCQHGYPVTAVIQWAKDHVWRNGPGMNPVDHGDADADPMSLKSRYDIAEVLKMEFEAELKRLKVAKEKGLLVDRESVKAFVEEMFHRVRARLEQIPQEVATTVPPEIRADVMADFKHKISLVLRELEGWAG